MRPTMITIDVHLNSSRQEDGCSNSECSKGSTHVKQHDGKKRKKANTTCRASKQYSFADDQVDTNFYPFMKGDKLKLFEHRHSKEVARINHLKHCLIQQKLGYAIKNCYILKVNNLIDANVLFLCTEKKKIATNIISLQFRMSNYIPATIVVARV